MHPSLLYALDECTRVRFLFTPIRLDARIETRNRGKHMKSIKWALCGALLLTAASAHALKLSTADYAVPVPQAQTASTKLVVTVIDSRPYVLDGQSTESYEGMTRELYGIPISRNTADKSAMASYLGQQIIAGLENASFVPSYLKSDKDLDEASAVNTFLKSQGDQFVVIRLHDWQYDMGTFHPLFTYDISIDVFDRLGRSLASRKFSGTEEMPTGGWKHFKKRWAETYQAVLGRAFSDDAIRAAVNGELTSTARIDSEAPESIDLRLARLKQIKDQGLIDDEVFEREQQRILQSL